MKYIICDLDGTIADCSHRLHHIEKDPKDWGSFFAECEDDKPIESMVFLIDNFIQALLYQTLCDMPQVRVIYSTGRPERIRNKTRDWLRHEVNRFIPHEQLLMRPDGDHRPAEVVKLEQVAKAGIKPEDILCVFDDDEKVCKAWKDLGVTVYKVV